MSSTIHLTTKEDRRTWQALTRCAPSVDERAELAFVALDGDRAYGTDGYLIGTLPASVDLPVLETVDEDTGEITYGQPDRILIPARLLRDAVALGGPKVHVRIRLDEDAAKIILGDDPLPGLGDAPTVTIPYADAPGYPNVARLADLVTPDPLEIIDDDGRDVAAEAGEIVTRIGLAAKRLGRLGDLEYRHDGEEGGHVTIRPRSGSRVLEIRAAATDVILGILSPLHLGDSRTGHTASGEPTRTEVTITASTAETLSRHLGEDPDDE